MEKNRIAVWNVTTRCNQACEFCFGPKDNSRKEISTKDAKKKINKFVEGGYQKLIFTGGEPLLRNDIIELIKYAKQSSLYTILHTNGILVTCGFLKEISKYLDQINLPLDEYNEKTNDIIRSCGHYEKILIILQQLKNKKIKIIISTVAFKKNIKNIKKIGSILPGWVYKWRVFQVRGLDKSLAVTDKDFENLNLGKYNFLVQKVSSKDVNFDNTYEII